VSEREDAHKLALAGATAAREAEARDTVLESTEALAALVQEAAEAKAAAREAGAAEAKAEAALAAQLARAAAAAAAEAGRALRAARARRRAAPRVRSLGIGRFRFAPTAEMLQHSAGSGGAHRNAPLAFETGDALVLTGEQLDGGNWLGASRGGQVGDACRRTRCLS
jgi:hypothetical protein